MTDYPAPVNQFLITGDPWGHANWPDHVHQFGLGSEHIPDLIRMVSDRALYEADSENPVVWASLHAWRALGQLRAVEAVPPLLALLGTQYTDFNDWM